MNYSSLLLEFQSLPDELKQQVADFIHFLNQKREKNPKPKKRKAGLAKGKIKMAADFDAPLEDFKDYM